VSGVLRWWRPQRKMAKPRQARRQTPPATPRPMPALAPLERLDEVSVVARTVDDVVGGVAVVDDVVDTGMEGEIWVVDGVELSDVADEAGEPVVPGEDGAEFVDGDGTASKLMYSGVRGWTG